MPDVDLADALLGKTVGGRYEIRKHLGSGGFGSVFAADQILFGRPIRKVALKITKRTRSEVSSVDEFFKDAALLGQVAAESHDSRGKQHLMSLYDLGVSDELDGRGYTVMEYIEGKLLADHIRLLGRCPVATGVNWATQLCAGLAVLHRLKPPIVHRDLKPDNVIISVAGELKIIDFGLSCRLDETLSAAIGDAFEIHSVAPEVFLNQTTCASDVYSVGLMLYELFAGFNPFAPDAKESALAETDRLTYQFQLRHSKKLQPLAPRNNEVDRELESIVLKCLEPEPSHRYSDAPGLLQALSAWERGETREPYRVLLDEGKAFCLDRRFGEAEERLTEALKLIPEKQDALVFDACFWLGRAHLELSRTDGKRKSVHVHESVRLLEQARKLNEKLARLSRVELAKLYENLEEAYRSQGNLTLSDDYKRRKAVLI